MAAHDNQSDVFLDAEHQTVLHRAVANILSLDVAEHAFAQILDGLPTRKCAGRIPRDHLVVQLAHNEVCDGHLAQARELRKNFDPSLLSWEPWTIQAFQDTTPGTTQFSLCLIDLVVAACHQIAAHLYERDDGTHKHQLHRDWYAQAEQDRLNGQRPRGTRPSPVAFSHKNYRKPERFVQGEADVAGYWAEGQIFGGVVLFDRGASEQECHSMWLHGADSTPKTLYPPTDAQFRALVSFLLSDPKDNQAQRAACPLPIRGTWDNRPRWDPYEAASKFHIFRVKGALQIPTIRYRGCTSIQEIDWPELRDSHAASNLRHDRDTGAPYDKEALQAAEVGARWITPTSPQYYPMPDWMRNSGPWAPDLPLPE